MFSDCHLPILFPAGFICPQGLYFFVGGVSPPMRRKEKGGNDIYLFHFLRSGRGSEADDTTKFIFFYLCLMVCYSLLFMGNFTPFSRIKSVGTRVPRVRYT